MHMKMRLLSQKLLLKASFLVVIFFIFSFEYSQPLQETNPDSGYYIVVAAYRANQHGYASRLVSKITSSDTPAKYAYFKIKHLLFVYLEYHTERTKAIENMRNIRKKGKFADAWVYVYKPEGIENTVVESENVPQTKEAEVKATEVERETEDTPKILEPEPEQKQEQEQEQKVEPEPESVPEAESDPNDGKYLVYFKINHGRTGELIDTRVQIIDPRSGKIINSLQGNTWQYIDKPSNSHSDIQLETDVFGFRKKIQTFNMDFPVNDTTGYFIDIKGDSIEVLFDLVRFEKGDIFTMYNVYFFSHSAIMRPESKNEMDQLLAMLKENSLYKIRIHGHTNGGTNVEALYLPESASNYFSKSGAMKAEYSAKKLSEMRAETVMNYLIQQGISKDRMELKGWGGKKMLYKKLDPQAIKNVRVEIEILEN